MGALPQMWDDFKQQVGTGISATNSELRDAPHVVVSNATRLHAHRLAQALQKRGLLRAFCTSLWDTGWRIPLGSAINKKQESFWARRQLAGLDIALIKQFPAAELVRLAASPFQSFEARDRGQFLQKQRYDAAVARWISRNPPEIFVGYEISCAQSFAAAKAAGCMTILDLAGLPHDLVSQARDRHGLPGDLELELALGRQKTAELALADHVLCLSKLARDGLVAQGVEPSRISIVPLGTDLGRFRPAPITRNESEPLRLLFVGGVHKAKGVHTLLAAAALLGPEKVKVTIAGPVIDPDLLRGVGDIAQHVGFVDHDALANLYHKADVFVLPSLWESWGQVTVEAMASGRPVIVSDCCGSADLVDESNGWVFPAGDTDALETCLVEAARDLSRLEIMGRAAAQRVAKSGWNQYDANVTQEILQAHTQWSARW